jgi:hypothetical protein
MTKKFLIFFAAALFVTAVPAFALTITQTKNFSGIPNMNGSLNFNQFNNSGGLTLTSIQVSLALQTNGGQLTLDNDSNSPASGTFQFGAKGNISSTDVTLLNTIFQPVPGEVNAIYSSAFSLAANTGDGPGDYDPTPPDGLLYNGGTINNSKSDYITSAVWTTGTKGFIGAGTYNINYSVSQWLDYGSIGGIEYAVNPVNASGDVTVIYNYVPEPATITLLCTGLVFLLKRKGSK